MDPMGVLSSITSGAVNELLELVKSAMHCKDKCRELEDLLARATIFLDELKEYAAQGSLISPRLEPWLKGLQAVVKEARSPVRQCQSSHVLDIPSRAKIAQWIDECSKRIREYLDDGEQNVGQCLEGLHEVKGKKKEVDVVPKEEQHFVSPEDQIFGMEETLEEVVSNLLLESNNKWVGVYGVGGAGKTLLAKRVSKNSRVMSHFHQILWLTFGRSCQVEAIQKELAQQINYSLSSGGWISNKTLSRVLHGKRCLLILDDVWEAGNLDLFDVIQANGSRIFITTRIPHVLDSKGATKTHLGLLGEEDSMKLFMLHAFPNQIDARKDFSEVQVVKQVVWKCGGLPLVLKVIGSRMARREHWDCVLEQLNEQQFAFLDEEQQVLQRLKLGYDALHSHGFQQHFLYFAAYPEDYGIPFWELFRCWKGEGLVSNTADAINVLETLKNYALITEEKTGNRVRDWYLDDDEKVYRIHDALLALALQILNIEGPKCYLKAGQKDADLESHKYGFKWISLMSCDIRWLWLHTSEKNKATTCLLLDDNEILEFPDLSNLKNLKVLCLRNTKLVYLPDSIGNLRNLETLDLRNNDFLERIPSSLENLIKLSYLDVGMCRELQVFPVDALLNFSNLVFFDGGIWNQQLDLNMFQTLTKLEVLRLETDSNVEIPASISKLSQLKELSISGQIMHIHGNFQMTNLEILTLESFFWDWVEFSRLVMVDFGLYGDDVTCMKSLESLRQEKFPKLEELELRNCRQWSQARFQLASLKELRVSDCCFIITNFSIAFLPNLELLEVRYCKGVNAIHISECPSLRCIITSNLPWLLHFTLAGKFPQLHIMLLDDNERLSSVTIGTMDDACSQLELLWFQNSENLEVMPHGVERLPLLQHLNLHGCKKLKVLPFGDSEDSSFYPSLRVLDLRNTSISKAQLSQRLVSLPHK